MALFPLPLHLFYFLTIHAHAGQLLHRGMVVGFGCLIWSLCAALFACSTSIAAALPAWALAGASLAFIVPNAQSLVADLYRPEKRGLAFGLMHLSASSGGLVAALAT